MLEDAFFITTYKCVLYRNRCYVNSSFIYGVDVILVFLLYEVDEFTYPDMLR